MRPNTSHHVIEGGVEARNLCCSAFFADGGAQMYILHINNAIPPLVILCVA
jgi:hypothetical protein